MKRALPLLAAAAVLAGCVSFGEKPPATLFTLTAETPLTTRPAMVASEANAITIVQPTAPQTLSGLRLPVTSGATSIAYFPKAQFADAPARLFRDLLGEVIAQRTGRPVVDQRNYSLAPGARLTGRLLAFQYDSASRNAVVGFEAVLVRGSGQPVQTERFEARVPAGTEDGATIAAALNGAANQVAVQVSDWIGAAA